MNKKVILPMVLAGVITAVGFTGVQIANANEPGNGLAAGFAQRFGLDETEVEDYMSQMREEHMQERQLQHQANLEQAVADGVITQEQLEALNAKHEEMQAQREQSRTEMDAWFEDQGIDQDALHEYMGGHRGGPGFGR